MRRRDVIALLGGAAAGSRVARAQSPPRPRHIALLIANTEGDPDGRSREAAFRQALASVMGAGAAGLRIDVLWGISDLDRARSAVTALPALTPDVIVASGTAALAALHGTVRNTPIEFVQVVDPVVAGFVESLSRPGANITGFSTFEPEIGGKWVEALREMSPAIRRVAGIIDPGFDGYAAVWRASERAAVELGIVPSIIHFRGPADDIETPVASFAESGAQAPEGGLIVLPTPINVSLRGRIMALAARHRLPAIYPFRYYAVEGGLMYYGFGSVPTGSTADTHPRGRAPRRSSGASTDTV
jgi:putative ABC transport system substrate-binding protein